MSKRNLKLHNAPWYVIFLSFVFPLILYANNLGEATLRSLSVPLVSSFLFGLIIFIVFYLMTRNIHKAGLITFVIELFVFSYGHFYELLKNLKIFDILIGRHRFVFPFLLLLLVLVVWRISKLHKPPKDITTILNIVTICFFLFQSVRIIIYEVRVGIANARTEEASLNITDVSDRDDLRDIYLIVLDAYSRSDWLYEWSGYDNSGFLNELEEMGFYVVPCSRSNYSYTIQAMTSELNMDYLDHLSVSMNNIDLSHKLKHSRVRTTLSQMGYEFVFFETGYPQIEMMDVDRFIEVDENVNPIDDFVILFMTTTILRIPVDIHEARINEYWDPALERHARRVWSAFEYLQKPMARGKPVFVYAHIISPHNPACFNANGLINFLWEDDPEATKSTYRYINDEVVATISAILDYSEEEPIIILQLDHGNGDYEYANLNLSAYYLPDGGDEWLYPTITPVNTFRVIFNHYFGYELPLLEDLSFYSKKLDRYNFQLIEDPYDYCQKLSEEYSTNGK